MLLQLGSFIFQISSAAYETLTRRTRVNWARLGVLNSVEHLHAVNQEGDVIKLDGTVYPELEVRTGGKGGTDSIDTLREMAKTMKPHQMTSSEGIPIGYWAIEEIRNRDSKFFESTPRKQEFRVSLRYYGESYP